jgi:hypothetical protein
MPTSSETPKPSKPDDPPTEGGEDECDPYPLRKGYGVRSATLTTAWSSAMSTFAIRVLEPTTAAAVQ